MDSAPAPLVASASHCPSPSAQDKLLAIALHAIPPKRSFERGEFVGLALQLRAAIELLGGTPMALSPRETELSTLQKFKKHQIDLLRNGVRIEAAAGKPLDELIKEASIIRYRLSRHFLFSAKRLYSHKPVPHRDVISRSYYSMYHAARAIVFLVYQGDDFEPHDKLAGGIPKDFPDVTRWQNELKDARLKRNEADYEPIPFGHTPFRRRSRALLACATEFLTETEGYLRRKGCHL